MAIRIHLISTMNRIVKSGCDRALPSELNEPPINPLLIHMEAPIVEKNNPTFIIYFYRMTLNKQQKTS